MKKVLFLDTSIATSNIGDEIINISIKNNFPEIFNDNYIYITYQLIQEHLLGIKN